MSSLISKNLQVGSDPTATNNFTIFQPATPDGTLRIGNGNTGITSSLLTLTSGGNFGVGTNAPGSKLTVSNAGNVFAQVSDTTNSVNSYFGVFNQVNWIGTTTNHPITFNTNNTERLRLDASGNLGLGVTPSAWTTYSAFQLGAQSSLAGNASFALLSQNWRYDGTDRYIATAAASQYYQGAGQHVWRTAPSGTAGNAISFTQAMTLDASGNLLVGTTSTGTFAQSNGSMLLSTGRLLVTNTNDAPINGARLGSDGSLCQWFRGGALVGSISVNSSATAYNTSSDYRLKNITGPITTSGAYIDSLNPVEGTWKADGSTFVGLIAHEVQEASRTPVATGTKDGEQMQGMDYSSAEIIANMLAELKSLRARVAQLEAK